MSIPTEIKPQSKSRVMDLVQQAGLDISDWPNYARGLTNPGANPKYCYEWALKEPGKLVVCNLWYGGMLEINGGVEQHLVLRDTSQRKEKDPTRRARRSRMEELLVEAFQDGLPIRVVVLDGKTRTQTGNGKTNVQARTLDPVTWAVTAVNRHTGEVVLRRGVSPQHFSDQFSLPEPPDGKAVSRNSTVTIVSRNAAVRQFVLERAGGKCEYCGIAGFKLNNGSLFLETHHIVSLSQSGPDSVNNVVALCPNHHREAHYGRRFAEIREALQDIVGSR